jgi:hypothetical protein
MVDESELGRDALVVLAGVDAGSAPVVGFGIVDLRLHSSLSLPVDEASMEQVLAVLRLPIADALVLRPDRRVARANGREVALTRIEFR